MAFSIKSTLAFFILVVVVTSCKKGEDDPVVSFRTRKARISGNWTMKKGYNYESRTGGGSVKYVTNTLFEEDAYVATTEGFGPSGSSTGSAEVRGKSHYTLKIDKNGNFRSERYKETGSPASSAIKSIIMSGAWNFTNAVGKHKNKGQIVVNQISITDNLNNTSASQSYGGDKTYYTYTIKELRNKKLVLVCETAERLGSYDEYILKEEYTFEQ